MYFFSVCEVVVNELEKGIAAVDPKKVIDLGGRLEADGSRKVIKVGMPMLKVKIFCLVFLCIDFCSLDV